MSRLPRSVTFLIMSAALAAMLSQTAGGQSATGAKILGETELTTPPAPPVNVRVSEGTFPPNAPAITHSHAAGWVYVVQGAHVLVMGGRSSIFHPGQAVWTPAGVEHTHDWDRSQTHKFWFIGIGTNQPPAVPQGFRLFHLTGPLEGLRSAAYRVRLSSVTLPPDTRGPLAKIVDPELLIGLSGTLSMVTGVGTGEVGPEQVLLIQPGSAYLLRNLSQFPASVLIQSLIPKE